MNRLSRHARIFAVGSVLVATVADALTADQWDAATYARHADLIALVRVESVEKQGVANRSGDSDSHYLYSAVPVETLRGPNLARVRFLSSREIAVSDSPVYLIVATREPCREPKATTDPPDSCPGGFVYSTWQEVETLNKVEERLVDGQMRRVVMVNGLHEWFMPDAAPKIRPTPGARDSHLLMEDARSMLLEWSKPGSTK